MYPSVGVSNQCGRGAGAHDGQLHRVHMGCGRSRMRMPQHRHMRRAGTFGRLCGRQTEGRTSQRTFVLGRSARIEFDFVGVTVVAAGRGENRAHVRKFREPCLGPGSLLHPAACRMAARMCRAGMHPHAVARKRPQRRTARRRQVEGEQQEGYGPFELHVSSTPHSARRAIHASASRRAVASATS